VSNNCAAGKRARTASVRIDFGVAPDLVSLKYESQGVPRR